MVSPTPGSQASGRAHPKHLRRFGIAIEVHPHAVPMIVEVATLDRVAGEIGVEEPCALAIGVAPGPGPRRAAGTRSP